MRKLVWLLALAACAGDDDSGGGGGDGGGSGSDPANVGYIAVSAYNAVASSMTIAGGSVSASFTLNTSAASCTDHAVDACHVYVCPQTPVTPTYASGGTVMVAGLAQAVTMMPMGDKTYAPFSSQQQVLYAGGETLTFSGTGADTPAFSFSMTAPSRASITSPAKPSSGMLTIDRSQDFAVNWTGGGSGKVYVYVGGPTGSYTSIACGFDASAGTGKVPTGALSMLGAGMGSFSVSSLALESMDAGGWRIYGQAFYTGVWATDMSMAAVNATLQ